MATAIDLSGNNPTDQKFHAPNRTAANLAAVLLLTPLYPGEIVLDLATGLRYRGLQMTVGRWGECAGEVTPHV